MQLVDHGPAAPIRPGTVIRQDRTLPTQLFQTTLSKVRELVDAAGRPQSDHVLGVLRTIADATAGKGGELTAAAQGLNRIVTEMNTLRTDDSGPPALQTWTDAVTALGATAPELLDSLRDAVTPMRTVAERHAALSDLLLGANRTVGTMRTAMDNHTDKLVEITTNLTPVLGVLADRSAKFPAIAIGVNTVIDKFFNELWTRTGKKVTFTFKLVVSLAPLRLYTRADCPVYGELRGPSCETAPLTPTAPDTRGLPDPRAYVPLPGIELPEPTNAADEVIIGALRTPPEPPQFLGEQPAAEPAPPVEPHGGTP